MASVSRDRDCARLEQELQTDEYQNLLERLQRTERFLRQFTTWADVIVFMRSGISTDARKDDVLRPIFAAHAGDQDARWRTILLEIFWPGLESIHFHKRAWDVDPHERWQNIVWTFLQVICRIDVKRRPDRLVQKVFNDTIHHLHDEYRRVWTRADRELAMDPENLHALSGRVEGINFARIDLRERQQIEIQRLRQHMEAGRISEPDWLLLIGTRVYGQSLIDYSRLVGLDYQVAMKRRQRAEAVIHRFEREGRVFSQAECPRVEASDPLYPYARG
ncbi:MAG: hypothetical protein COV75_08485 [Candidatus Omnitrophica bacterium CG11_big_fil_rev_8_21_14_0_20_63_9]|nr:MAG: hypothetical protein COV75_08485 [Candidatus Omnitrophica bacterium CG11_big_fil_rev_8_21_14_0_20_63_9]